MLKLLSISICLVVAFFTQTIYGQAVSDNLTLKFNLEFEPSIAALGLDNPESTWKISYKLRIADTVNYEKAKNSRKLKKSIIKAKTVTKGKLLRKSLAFPENRIILRDVVFDKNVLDRLGSNTTQTFFIELKWKMCSKTLKKRLNGMRNKNDCAKMSTNFELPADSIKFLPNGIFGIRMGMNENFGTFTFVNN